uniref:NADH-ubiquinone oxidoreductase chain 3 n=1 Tax=Falcidens halanychi TaxID=370642 RepID=A0A343X880_9MOLL|nr:NADH dehydrogenase subunit 3 [Falcidens halanychi]AWH02139.1 NADH dehydrogenase subunit 3 [Falcidens halanychi]
MMLYFFASLFAFIIISFLIFTIFFLHFRQNTNFEKFLPFECGFSMVKSPRVPFSTRFFLLTVIFLVFDIELVLLFPLVNYLNKTDLNIIISSSLIFLILMLGVIYEWKEGSFDWMK